MISTLTNSSKAKGVTLVEMIFVLALLAIILTLAVPSLEKASARSDVKEGTQMVANAIRMAKNTARVTNSQVQVTFDLDGDADITFAQTISLTGSNSLNIANMNLPDRLTLDMDSSDDGNSYTFDAMGMVQGGVTGSIVLRSTINTDTASTVSVTNAMGNLTVTDGAPEVEEES